METEKPNLKLDIVFTDIMKKKVSKNKANTYCYVYLPVDWVGHEVMILKLPKVEQPKVEEPKVIEQPKAEQKKDILEELGL